jgi:hypothetical protein
MSTADAANGSVYNAADAAGGPVYKAFPFCA